MRLITTNDVRPRPINPATTYTVEVTEGELARIARLSWLREGGAEFPNGTPQEGKRLHELVGDIAPHVAAYVEDTALTSADW